MSCSAGASGESTCACALTILGLNSSPNLFSLRGQAQFAGATVGATDVTFDQALCFEPVDQLTDVSAIESHQGREPALVDARKIVEDGESGVFLRRLGRLVGKRIRSSPGENLVKAPNQGKRDVVRHDTFVDGRELQPRRLVPRCASPVGHLSIS